MRRGNLFLCIATLFTLIYLVHLCSTLISLLFEDGQDDAIPSCNVPRLDEDQYGNSTQLIPKIIHQTYIDENIPQVWQAGQQACIKLHDDYEYKLWTDASSRDFIAEHYSWFLETFDSYKHPIQRADTIRYFVLSHFGGIYIDLDDGCERRLDPLLQYPAWVRMTTPTGVSNDVMGAVPGHPFLQQLIDNLQRYDRNWFMPYITVMFSTGPLFVSVMWKEYMSTVVSSSDEVRVLMANEYSKGSEPFFKIVKGDSWHQEDADTIFWMRSHWILLVVLGFALAGVLAYMAVRVCTRCSRDSSSKHVPTRSRLLPKWWPSGREDSEKHYYEEVARMA